jgi:diketogulonate reductase-like aldo/keto reductase
MEAPMSPPGLHRRAVLAGATALAAGSLAGFPAQAAAPGAPGALTKPIPSTGEPIPAVGLGTWITFNVGEDAALRDECASVMQAFFQAGGRMIDSSPMYGSAQAVVGHGLRKLGAAAPVFSADKVWTSSGGPAQVEETRRRWGVKRFDLLQVHNLLAWEEHLETLFAMKQAGELRYVGITTSEGRRHGELERIVAERPLDFVQLTYNPVDREAERRLLPLALERGVAVIVNRPFRQGELTQALAGEALPGFAAEAGAASWAQLILKFIVSHPAVTCAIPATSRVDHVRENMAAAVGPPLEEATRAKIAARIAEA